ncbi:MAG: TGS domain-containing protein [Candidatus Heimdallarchaeaceae archaeon]
MYFLMPILFQRVQLQRSAKEFAAKIHTDFAKNFIFGQLAPSGRRVGADYELQNNDIIKIVTATK